MAHELIMLGTSVVVGLAYVLIAGALATSQRGLKWNAGNRDGEVAALTGPAARAARAVANMMETFAFFAAAVLSVIAAGKASPQSALGTDLYVWARIAYLPTYIIGIPYLRTAVWLISLVGIILELEALFH